MLLLDATALLYASRAELPEHRTWRPWLERALGGGVLVGACNLTFATLVRVATSPRVFKHPTPLADVLEFVEGIRDAPAFTPVEPGPRHWALVESLCRATQLRGNLATDASLAALVTADRNVARYPKLKLHPAG